MRNIVELTDPYSVHPKLFYALLEPPMQFVQLTDIAGTGNHILSYTDTPPIIYPATINYGLVSKRCKTESKIIIYQYQILETGLEAKHA